jgi:small GTP-binding protein
MKADLEHQEQPMRESVLTDRQAQYLREEKEALAAIQGSLAEFDLSREALDSLQKAILQLDELFLIVVAGEFNAGKSALINALLGQKVLPEGTTPTTSRVTLVKWGQQAAEEVVDESFSIFTHPLPRLKELNIVDTPGTNAILRHHERLTEEFIPRSDLVLFVTSADHPLTESERQFLDRILAWGKKVVFALNKVDILEDDAALTEVSDFILKHGSTILGERPQLYPVSARLGHRAAVEPEPEERERLRASSRIDALEDYIDATLDDTSRLQLKFNNPLGVAEHLTDEAGKSLANQTAALEEDKKTAQSVEAVIAAYEGELHDELPPRLAEVENILHRLEQRGLDFYDSTMRLTNIQNLVRGERVRARFERAGRQCGGRRGADRAAGGGRGRLGNAGQRGGPFVHAGSDGNPGRRNAGDRGLLRDPIQTQAGKRQVQGEDDGAAHAAPGRANTSVRWRNGGGHQPHERRCGSLYTLCSQRTRSDRERRSDPAQGAPGDL